MIGWDVHGINGRRRKPLDRFLFLQHEFFVIGLEIAQSSNRRNVTHDRKQNDTRCKQLRR